jgi:hypothetical protein
MSSETGPHLGVYHHYIEHDLNMIALMKMLWGGQEMSTDERYLRMAYASTCAIEVDREGKIAIRWNGVDVTKEVSGKERWRYEEFRAWVTGKVQVYRLEERCKEEMDKEQLLREVNVVIL